MPTVSFLRDGDSRRGQTCLLESSLKESGRWRRRGLSLRLRMDIIRFP